jgi:dihydrofolate synthase/folylpolyglutamate synthase
MNYTQAVEYLNGFVNLERGPLDRSARAEISLDGVRELAGRLGNPHKSFASIHVAGTKGKGSTCAFAAAMLRAQGLHVGLYVSPHLEDLRERISIDGGMIPEADFARLLSACAPELEAMRQRPSGQRRPTYFEIVTHLAFAWFAAQRVDAAVLEVGLGGRLDATNIVEPEVCGIANISYDHTAILGETLTQIAGEKAGILKRGVPVVLAPQLPEATRTIMECAAAAGAPVETVGAEIAFGELDADHDAEWPLPRAWARFPDGREFRATLGLRGGHQVENWVLALRLADIFFRKKVR